MSFNKGIRSVSSRRTSSPSSINKKKLYSEQSTTSAASFTTTTTTERKMRSLQSLQERLCFTLKRPRTRRHNRGGPNSPHKDGYGGFKQAARLQIFADKSTLMESGLIQIPHLQCEYYESPSPLSNISSCFTQESVATSTSCSSSTTTASSTMSHVSASYSPISPLEYTSSDEGFSCDEVMSLVSCCPDMVMHNVLDFMSPGRREICKGPSATVATCRPPPAEDRGGRAAVAASRLPPPVCEMEVSVSDQANFDCPTSTVEDDGEPYRIDLCDFEPDANALTSPPQDGSHHHHQKNYGGGVLCLKLDYEEVLRAWKEREECLISREPMYYPSPYLDPLHIFGYAPFVPHPLFF